ncbi:MULTISPECIES: hypothetical protein [unclassified Anaeromyxobacter]|uniref:hypothetical protein n=1 Tax=unclassified Anaeromyxobacter TaxID=2620896 RepID=UPI001F5800AB|nr:MULTISPECIES: hypothetical protein [unclassified Anaeromyxobacter]
MRATPWILAALAAASVHCGGGGAGSSDPATLDADRDGVVRAQDCNDADPSVWRPVTAHPDADGDGWGAATEGVTCAGDALPPGWAVDGSDCDDGDARRWMLGEAYPDADGDGWGGGSLATICRGEALPPGWADAATDCAPDDAARWTERAYLYRDADGDGVTTHGVGVVCSGDALPSGYAMDASGQDCDDGDPAAFVWTEAFADADLDGHGGPAGTVCAGYALPSGWASTGGDCDEGDGGRWQRLSYVYVDRDQDGYTAHESGTVCSGWGLSWPYSNVSGWRGDGDCDDADAATHLAMYGYADADTDGVGGGAAVALCTTGRLPAGYLATGGDCAPDDRDRWREYAYTYRDADGDGHFVSSAGTLCYGTAVPTGYATSSALPFDCDDADPSVHSALWGYADADHDGVGAGQGVLYCTAGTLPADWVAAGTDCAAEDGGRWQVLPYAGLDEDGDGFTTRAAGSLCAGAALPDPYRAKVAGNDCDDADVALWRWTVLYPDADGDGIGTPPREIRCLGDAIPAGYSLEGWDAYPADPGALVVEGDPLAVLQP